MNTTNYDLFGHIQVRQPALRYHGSKFRLAPWIIQKMPTHNCYVEVYGGGAGVLLQKPRSYAEIYNDLDNNVVTFFKILRDPIKSKELLELVNLTPYSRIEFEEARDFSIDDEVEIARRFLIRSFMGFGSASCTKNSTGFIVNSKRETCMYNYYWESMNERLTPVIERLQTVIIENKSALELMPLHDSNDTLFYCDPPYVSATRSAGSNKYYEYEMTDSDHEALISYLHTVSGHVLLSGYNSELYNDLLSTNDWNRFEKSSRISAGRGTDVRMEYLWIRK